MSTYERKFPLSPEEAEAALASAASTPIPDEQIDAIVRYATRDRPERKAWNEALDHAIELIGHEPDPAVSVRRIKRAKYPD